jgi:pimeloyl-ACP methyl ester carboxylesterase
LPFRRPPEPDSAGKTRIVENYGKLPLSFEKNQGQTDKKVGFLSRGGGYTLFLTPDEAVFALRSPSGNDGPDDRQNDALQVSRPEELKRAKGAVIRMKFSGANPAPVISGEERLQGTSNYFIGNDPSKWRTRISKYAKVRYREVYPGIDLVFYGNQRRLEYDFVVSPGSDPSKIRLEFQGVEEVILDENGNLVLRLKDGEVIQHAPVIYQEVDGKRVDVAGGYWIDRKGRVGCRVASWDRQRPLVIDPVLVYSTYLGGNDYDSGHAIAVDGSGNAYVTGHTLSPDFPTVKALYPTYGGGSRDAFIFKLSADGSRAVYSTYLGGNAWECGYDIAVDSSGNAYVTGTTCSPDFPTVNALYPIYGGGYTDVFIAKISDNTALGYIDHFSFSPISFPQTVGTPFQVTISARDVGGGLISSFNDEVSLTSNIGSVSPTSVWLVNGQATASVTLYNQGTVRLNCNGHGAYGYSNFFDVTGGGACQGSIWGNVIDLRDDPVWQAEVKLYDLEGLQIGTSVLTDTAGKFGFTGLACDTYELRVEKNGANKEGIEVPPSSLVIFPDIVLPLNAGTSGTPVILVPGMMGSSNGKYSPYPKLPETLPARNLHIHAPKTTGWEHLKAYLINSGFNAFDCPWDWRMKISKAYKHYLIPKINEALSVSTTGKVHIVAHSMGGLVARAYIQGDKYRNYVDKLVMVGTPNLGSSNPYYIWEGGDPKLVHDLTDSGYSSSINIYSNTIQNLWEETYDKKLWSNLRHKAIREFIQDKGPSLLELMNVEKFLIDGSNDRGATIDGDNTDLKELNTDPDIDRMSPDGAGGTVQVGLFVGNRSESTIEKIEVHGTQPGDDLYKDGRPKWPRNMKLVRGNGDGTVPYASAVWPYTEGWADLVADNSQKSHTELIKDYVEEIFTFLAESVQAQSMKTLTAAAVGADDTTVPTLSFSVTGAVRICVTGPQGNRAGVDPVSGNPLEDIQGSRVIFGVEGGEVGIDGPVAGTYNLIVFGEAQRDFHLDIGYTDDDTTEIRRFRGFCPDTPCTFTISVAPSGTPRITVTLPVEAPTGFKADPYTSGATEYTRLTWNATGEAGVTGYNIYSVAELDPYFARVATVAAGTTSYDSVDQWSSESSTQVMTYAVTAVKSDGSESLFSDLAQNNDRDHDGLTDEEEASLGTNPTNPDTDGDGLKDGDEEAYGTDPLVADTDGDGYSDYEEIQAGSDPLDKNSVPTCTFGFGSVDVTTDPSCPWQAVNLLATCTNPVVIIGPPTYHGTDPGVVRIQNVTTIPSTFASRSGFTRMEPTPRRISPTWPYPLTVIRCPMAASGKQVRSPYQAQVPGPPTPLLTHSLLYRPCS